MQMSGSTTHDAAVVVSSRCMTFCSCLVLLLYRKEYRIQDCMQIAEAGRAEEGAGGPQCRSALVLAGWATLPVEEGGSAQHSACLRYVS